ncbi:MAG: TonB-dependent receptor [Flavobacteriales bacterium]|nr:TonB-dependent receptor [Flavobacteriales bacterium]
MNEERVILSSKQKALRINLNQDIYGTFAEIGAGQEVVRHFFRSGGASGTIAKAMSAYDKDFSDAIYGRETKGRYVCKARVVNMLRHEYDLIVERLDRDDHPSKCFFTYANTIATINFQKTIQGHGWMGVKFQTKPNREPNTVIVHLRFHENDASLQQESCGVMGVNLLYGCYFFQDNPKELLLSLYDNLSRDQVEIDMIEMSGPDFDDVDNRLLSLQLVKNGMTDAVIFSPDGRNLQAADVLYKKNILAIRGSFRPVTKVNIDMIMKGYKMFEQEHRVVPDNIQVLFEITLNNLKSDGDIDEQDFLDRADILCSLGQTVLISNYTEYYKLVEYFSRYTKKRMGLIMGINNLLEVFNEKYYRNLNGGILESFGILFSRDLKIYLYPWKDSEKEEFYTSANTPIHPRLKPLFNYLIFNRRMVDIEDYNEDILDIFSKDCLEMIKSGKSGWEQMVPTYVDTIIKDNNLFGYSEGIRKGLNQEEEA